MFNLHRFLAFFKTEPRTPFDAALRDLAHGRADAALAQLDALLAAESNAETRAQIANKRGVALVALQRRDEARRAFEGACEIVAEFAPALVNLGNLELEAARCDAAVDLYRRALASDESYAPAHRHLGLAYKRMGRAADALREFSRARRLEGRVSRKQRKV